jgi:hypothetical protein
MVMTGEAGYAWGLFERFRLQSLGETPDGHKRNLPLLVHVVRRCPATFFDPRCGLSRHLQTKARRLIDLPVAAPFRADSCQSNQ